MHERLWSTVWGTSIQKEQINIPTACYRESTWPPQQEGDCIFIKKYDWEGPQVLKTSLGKSHHKPSPWFIRLAWESISAHLTPESGDTLVALNFTSCYNCNIKINLPDWLQQSSWNWNGAVQRGCCFFLMNFEWMCTFVISISVTKPPPQI